MNKVTVISKLLLELLFSRSLYLMETFVLSFGDDAKNLFVILCVKNFYRKNIGQQIINEL